MVNAFKQYTLSKKLESVGVDSKALLKLLVEFKDKEAAKINTVSEIDSRFQNLKFFRDYINGDD
jgi:hypothetical protein